MKKSLNGTLINNLLCLMDGRIQKALIVLNLGRLEGLQGLVCVQSLILSLFMHLLLCGMDLVALGVSENELGGQLLLHFS